MIARHRRAGDPICIVQSRPVTVVAAEAAPAAYDPVAVAQKYVFSGKGLRGADALVRRLRVLWRRRRARPIASAVESMRIVTQRTTGGPEVLEIGRAPVPEPLPTEIRVRVAAAGVNPVDWKTRAGSGMAKVIGPPPFTVGWDVAGTVDAVGVGVTRFAVGDTVFGMPWFPRAAKAYAESSPRPRGTSRTGPPGCRRSRPPGCRSPG